MRPCPAVQTTSPGQRQHTSPTSQTIGFTEHLCVGITAAAITVLTNSVSGGQQPYAGSIMGGGVGIIGSNSRTYMTDIYGIYIFVQ
jgi:hypothetical protein